MEEVEEEVDTANYQETKYILLKKGFLPVYIQSWQRGIDDSAHHKLQYTKLLFKDYTSVYKKELNF